MLVSASFGDDIWEAQNYGQIMYAIRTRNGNVYLKIKRNFGDMSALQVRRARVWEGRRERTGGCQGRGRRGRRRAKWCPADCMACGIMAGSVRGAEAGSSG